MQLAVVVCVGGYNRLYTAGTESCIVETGVFFFFFFSFPEGRVELFVIALRLHINGFKGGYVKSQGITRNIIQLEW